MGTRTGSTVSAGQKGPASPRRPGQKPITSTWQPLPVLQSIGAPSQWQTCPEPRRQTQMCRSDCTWCGLGEHPPSITTTPTELTLDELWPMAICLGHQLKCCSFEQPLTWYHRTIMIQVSEAAYQTNTKLRRCKARGTWTALPCNYLSWVLTGFCCRGTLLGVWWRAFYGWGLALSGWSTRQSRCPVSNLEFITTSVICSAGAIPAAGPAWGGDHTHVSAILRGWDVVTMEGAQWEGRLLWMSH